MDHLGNEFDGLAPEALLRLALSGDSNALNHIVKTLQGDVYGLSLRMLGNRHEAEDAAQEILVRIVTRLSQFDGRSKLKTWAYRIAVNSILDMKKSAVERFHQSFEQMAEGLSEGGSADSPSETEASMLVEEVKIGCTLGMLQCLDWSHRLAFVLGDILELPGPEAAETLEIKPELFRKRLQNARTAMVNFMRMHCGLVSETAACRCNRHVPNARKTDGAEARSCEFASRAASFEQSRSIIRQMDKAQWALQVHRSSNPKAPSVDFIRRLIETFEPGLKGN